MSTETNHGDTDQMNAPAHFKLRESEPPGRVILFKNDVPVFSNADYAATAEYAERTYSLSDATLLSMYRDYRKDYDNR